MWLILSVMAAVITTFIWYVKAPGNKYLIGSLSLAFWGASIMWFIDHVVAYLSRGGAFFEIDQNATTLGILVVISASIVWIFALLIKDPKNVLRRQ